MPGVVRFHAGKYKRNQEYWQINDFSEGAGTRQILPLCGRTVQVFLATLLRAEENLFALVSQWKCEPGIQIHATDRILDCIGVDDLSRIRPSRFCRASQEESENPAQHPDDAEKGENAYEEQQFCRS